MAEKVDALVYDLQLRRRKISDLTAAYSALDKVRRYFEGDYRHKELDLFRRELNETINGAPASLDKQTAKKVRSLFDGAVADCIKNERLFETNADDARRWLEVAQVARAAAYQHHQARTFAPDP
ncbi:MAG: hypothetical protein RLO08_14300 [Parvibaculaceae bacterium]